MKAGGDSEVLSAVTLYHCGLQYGGRKEVDKAVKELTAFAKANDDQLYILIDEAKFDRE
jgi:hypothetical protein